MLGGMWEAKGLVFISELLLTSLLTLVSNGRSKGFWLSTLFSNGLTADTDSFGKTFDDFLSSSNASAISLEFLKVSKGFVLIC
jgi:hypothetical protein